MSTKYHSTTIRNEFAGEILGVKCRFHNVIVDHQNDKLIRNQKVHTERRKIKSGEWKGYEIQTCIRFDDECKNGHHHSFSITGEIANALDRARNDVSCFGCIHDQIAKHFPELKSLIKWHLTSSDGPMHYVGNTCYHASNRDYSGRLKGEPIRFDHVVRIGDSPITHRVKESFWNWLSEKLCDDSFEFVIERIEHRKTDNYSYGPKFTFAGYAEKWHECPFDNEETAKQWLEAVKNCQIVFDKIPVAFSEGKERNLDAARSCAVWPEATDQELCLPRNELEKLLLDRLPGLLAEFKSAIESTGMIYDVESLNR